MDRDGEACLPSRAQFVPGTAMPKLFQLLASVLVTALLTPPA